MQTAQKSGRRGFVQVTAGAVLVALGVYFFKFPNHFTFGGVSGLSVVLAELLPFSAGKLNLFLNLLFLVVGLLAMGRQFAAKTAWATLVISLLTERLEVWFPVPDPLTSEPLLELVFAILLPGLGAALLFQQDASGGGTDIIAAVLKQRCGMDVGRGLLFSDILIVVLSALVFDIQTVLISTLGLLTKSLVVDGLIQNLNLCKCFIVVCDDPEPICTYITKKLNRSATVCKGKGAFSHNDKHLVFAALRPAQAYRLRNFIHSEQPQAFMMISSSSEIVGKGFMAV